jgi:shikimate kinase
MADDSAPARLSLVELVGPAGAGKSTVFQSLLARDQAILSRPSLRKTKYAAVVAVNIVGALATLIRRGAIERHARTEQVLMMMYLQTLPRILPWLVSPGRTAMVFDQGPLFFLTRPSLMDRRLAKWRNGMLDTWAPLLDVVVFLDAPDTLLRERVNTRQKSHALKGAEARSALEVLRTSRQVYERTIEAVAARPGGPTILRFDTSTRSADEIADAILSAISGDAGSGPSSRVEVARLRSGQ